MTEEKKTKIERGVDDIFNQVETKPETDRKPQEIYDEPIDIKIDIEVDTDKEVDTPVDKKKPFRTIYVAGGILIVLIATIIFIIFRPFGGVPDNRSVKTSTVHKIRRPSPRPLIKKQEKKPGAEIKKEISVPDEIKEFLMKWKTAWEKSAGKQGDIEPYMSFYSDDFISKGMDKKGWRVDKTRKNRRKEWIRLELQDIHITEPVVNDRVEVSFFMTYKSSNFSDKTYQTLVLKKEAAGWKITATKAGDNRSSLRNRAFASVELLGPPLNPYVGSLFRFNAYLPVQIS